MLALLSAAPSIVFFAAGPRAASAVEPGVNCSSYTGPDGECVIPIGDTWFCEVLFQGTVCASSVVAGDTVRWEYSGAGAQMHTTTACGTDCGAPSSDPLWDSGLLNPGESFEVTFDAPGVYLYYCQVHPDLQRGLIRVLGPAVGMPGDANCSDETDAIDAALVLQLNAGLLDSLNCQQNADVNGDSRVDSIDAALILQYTAGLLDRLPP